MLKKYSTSLLNDTSQRLAEAGIALQVTKKRVKNINFRLKPNVLMVSVPRAMSAEQIAQAIDKRAQWSLDHHAQVLAQHYHHNRSHLSAEGVSKANVPVILWGVPQAFALKPDEKIAYYRQQLSDIAPALFAKWQPIVGVEAHQVRLKKMHTRWGSCNTRARRVWLSVYLPAYPIECTEYVIVHELCHLHHANHSREFWHTVATAMPEYQHWHNILAGKSGALD